MRGMFASPFLDWYISWKFLKQIFASQVTEEGEQQIGGINNISNLAGSPTILLKFHQEHMDGGTLHVS